jgi:CheY-like chemotaxis protein
MLRASLPSTIVVEQEIDMNSGLILADQTQIHQLLMNLCTNAFHAMEKTGGTLSIGLSTTVLTHNDLGEHLNSKPGRFVRISVRDTGVGILPEIQERIFDPYFTTKEVGKGTGMGLAIVHGIVKSYGGMITCHSTVGAGTVFRVCLPVVEEPAPQKAGSVDMIPVGTERILFVDDEIMLAEMGRTMLERLGYSVTIETSSSRALAAFTSRPDDFDLVITDQTMPGMTGIDLCGGLRKIRADIPIILCTGYSSIISEEQARNRGIQGFVRKPLARKEFATLIRKVLDHNKAAA